MKFWKKLFGTRNHVPAIRSTTPAFQKNRIKFHLSDDRCIYWGDIGTIYVLTADVMGRKERSGIDTSKWLFSGDLTEICLAKILLLNRPIILEAQAQGTFSLETIKLRQEKDPFYQVVREEIEDATHPIDPNAYVLGGFRATDADYEEFDGFPYG